MRMRLTVLFYLLPFFAATLFAGDDDVPPLKSPPAGSVAFSGALKDAAEKMALSPDGSSVAVIGTGGHLQLFDTATLKVQKDIEAPGVTGGIDFSADGKQVVVAGPGNDIQVWNLESGKNTRKFAGHTGEVHAVACSPDGSRVASTDGAGTVRIWDFNEGKLLFTLTGKKYPDDPPTESISTEGLAFTPDGRFIITEANDVKARVWDVAQGVELRMVADHDGTTASVSISPNGTLAATTRSGGIARIWKVDSGEIVRSLSGHDDDVTCSVFSSDEFTLFTGARDSTVRQWDIDTGVELRRFKLTAVPSALACSANGKRLFSLSPDAGLVAWDTTGVPLNGGKFAGSVTSLDTAWSALGSVEYDARAEAILFYLKYNDQPAAIKALVDRLNSGGMKEEDRKLQDDLVAKLDDPSYATRLKAAEDLKKLGHAARETLTRALKNESSEVRNKAAELLRDIGGAVDGRGFLAIEIFGLMHSPGAKDALTAIASKEGPATARAKATLTQAWGK